MTAALPALARRTVTLAWDPPAQPGITGYHVYYGTTSHRYTRVLAVTTEWATISDLVEGKTYYFAVTASNDLGLESAPSGELPFTVPPLPSGRYNGLFFESAGIQPASSGAFVLSVSHRGRYSGRLQINGRRYPFTGALDQHYRSTKSIARPGASTLTLELDLGSAEETDVVVGQVSDGTWTAALSGDRAVFRPKRNPAPWQGHYTVVFPGAEDDPAAPNGDGFGRVIVNARGRVHVAGRMADGTKFTRSALLSRQGQWPYYVSLYSARGIALSWMTVTGNTNNSLNGALCWAKQPDSAATFYPGGFVQQCNIVGSAYVAPNSAGKPVLNFADGAMIFSGGSVGAGFTNGVVVRSARIVSAPGAAGFSVRLSAAKGTFRGFTTDPVTGEIMRFGGVVLQNRDEGRGYLLGNNQSSRVLLAPRPANPAAGN